MQFSHLECGTQLIILINSEQYEKEEEEVKNQISQNRSTITQLEKEEIELQKILDKTKDKLEAVKEEYIKERQQLSVYEDEIKELEVLMKAKNKELNEKIIQQQEILQDLQEFKQQIKTAENEQKTLDKENPWIKDHKE